MIYALLLNEAVLGSLGRAVLDVGEALVFGGHQPHLLLGATLASSSLRLGLSLGLSLGLGLGRCLGTHLPDVEPVGLRQEVPPEAEAFSAIPQSQSHMKKGGDYQKPKCHTDIIPPRRFCYTHQTHHSKETQLLSRRQTRLSSQERRRCVSK